MSLLFNMLSRFAIAFLPKSKRLNFMAVVTVRSDFGAQENKICHCFHCLLRYNLQASLVAQMVKNLPEMQETWV